MIFVWFRILNLPVDQLLVHFGGFSCSCSSGTIILALFEIIFVLMLMMVVRQEHKNNKFLNESMV